MEGNNVQMSEILQMRKEIEEKRAAAEEVRASIFEQTFDSMAEIMPGTGMEEIAAALALPDEHFEVIAPQILLELQKAFNDPNDRLMMVQALNSHGVKAEDFQQMFMGLAEAIDNELQEISQAKRDFLKEMMAISANAMIETEGIARRVIRIPIEMADGAQMPKYARLGDAGLDVYSMEDVDILPGETKMISTGIKIAIPLGYAVLVQPRSGLSAKSKLRVANTPGLIDSGFRGEIKVILENIDNPIRDIKYDFDDNGNIILKSILHGSVCHVSKGDRIAQLRLVEVPSIQFYQVGKVPEDTERGVGGFGSTGTN